ncbi:hypothetical protein QBC34DRAFT_152776 [Podospora aff. communis PSN243]|uniref:G-protein coupled receptors family 2 profile 2 domain-containing protein n=1 Tax=Podospora aff. communis PSN243 TaxID=3040156 RepID=A0AAV9GC32_9PEZI|nr:hypothetical protein QBC34DRAFT_152776 [Podospora aff. communis PSN243]
MATTLPEDQVRALVILERVGGSLSLCAVIAVFVFFSLQPRLRTVPNTFILFAAIANTFSAIASIIAYDGIHQGQTNPLCQLQGFLFEMFTQSDAWWALAMAINTLLIYFHDADLHSLRKWGWLYCLICYGGPFGIALMCLLVTEPGKSPIYGDSGPWCWISDDWSSLRIYTCYMLVWACLLTSLLIYTTIGIRTHLHPSTKSHHHAEASHSRHPSSLSSPGMTAFLISSTPNRSPSPSIYTPSLHDIEPTPHSTPADDLRRSHLHTAILYTLSVAAPWTLTSIHRVHELIHPPSASGPTPFGLILLSALVIPLQGTFTACVLFYANWNTLRQGTPSLGMKPVRVGGVPTRAKRRSKPARQGKSVYSMWRDASPASGSGSGRRDSWDFLDIGIDESQRGGGVQGVGRMSGDVV